VICLIYRRKVAHVVTDEVQPVLSIYRGATKVASCSLEGAVSGVMLCGPDVLVFLDGSIQVRKISSLQPSGFVETMKGLKPCLVFIMNAHPLISLSLVRVCVQQRGGRHRVSAGDSIEW
jgi:hypothetical protein